MCIDEYLLFSITYRKQGQYKFSNSQRINHIDTDSKDADNGTFSFCEILNIFNSLSLKITTVLEAGYVFVFGWKGKSLL
jgi:hypothetical protein